MYAIGLTIGRWGRDGYVFYCYMQKVKKSTRGDGTIFNGFWVRVVVTYASWDCGFGAMVFGLFGCLFICTIIGGCARNVATNHRACNVFIGLVFGGAGIGFIAIVFFGTFLIMTFNVGGYCYFRVDRLMLV